MHSQSLDAQSLLENAVGHEIGSLNRDEMRSAIACFKEETSRPEPQQILSTSRQAVDSPFDFRRISLPPVDLIRDALRKSKDIMTYTLSPLTTNTTSRLTEQCKTVLLGVDDYPLSTSVVVNFQLYYLFTELSWIEADPHQAMLYRKNAALCKENFELWVINFSLLMPATAENAEALVQVALHMIDTARPSTAWKLITMAASLLQSMGWHRAASMTGDSEEVKRFKGLVLWTAYTIDKSLSLRLGRASNLQDYDIDVPLPEFGNDSEALMYKAVFHRWVNTARIQGLAYEQLYSAQGLLSSEDVRTARALSLAEQYEAVLADFEKASVIYSSGDNTSYFFSKNGFGELFTMSEMVIHFATLTLIYRAVPGSGNDRFQVSEACLTSARSALEVHMAFSAKFKEYGEEVWQLYVNWSILQAPFVPFIVLLYNVMKETDMSDLKRLDDFVESISDSCLGGDAVVKLSKLHRMCSAFCKIARIYIESRLKERELLNVPNIGQELGDLNPYLDALGFSGDLAFDASTEFTLGDWFSGNQHMLDLLESDQVDLKLD